MAGSLAKESCEEGSLANVCVTICIEVHFITCFVGCGSERGNRRYVRNGHKYWRLCNVEKINIPVEIDVNGPIVR